MWLLLFCSPWEVLALQNRSLTHVDWRNAANQNLLIPYHCRFSAASSLFAHLKLMPRVYEVIEGSVHLPCGGQEFTYNSLNSCESDFAFRGQWSCGYMLLQFFVKQRFWIVELSQANANNARSTELVGNWVTQLKVGFFEAFNSWLSPFPLCICFALDGDIYEKRLWKTNVSSSSILALLPTPAVLINIIHGLSPPNFEKSFGLTFLDLLLSLTSMG